ncbi:sensor histidine kinase/response regulator [Pseudomonas sp. R5-89-07]|nr:sensor histidine kinase/response regulator [Pseudomonas sp. R5-89-07]
MKIMRSKLRNLSRSMLRFNSLLLYSFLLTLFFFGTSYWAIYTVVEEQRVKVNYHYFRMVGAIHEHELFLLQVARLTSAAFKFDKPLVLSSVNHYISNYHDFYDVEGGERELAFSMMLPKAILDGQAIRHKLELAMKVSKFRKGFWDDSPYSAPQLFVLDSRSVAGFSIPPIDRRAGRGETARNGLRQVIEKVARNVRSLPSDSGSRRVHWRPASEFLGAGARETLAYVSGVIPDKAWGINSTSSKFNIAALFELDSLYKYGQPENAIFDSLDLISPEGVVVIGADMSKSDYGNGIFLTQTGLLIKRSSGFEKSWQAFYHIGYQRLFHDAKWSLLNVLLLLISCLGLGYLLLRWQRRNIVDPADRYYGSLISRNEFSHGVIQATPVALCVIKERGRQVVLQNSLASEWVGDLKFVAHLMLDWHMFEGGEPVSGEACVMINALCLHARFAPTTYHGSPASLCAFIDITAYKNSESELVRARNLANLASAEKSRFLACMSHEIRTPLYGVVGTLELLGLTPISQQQAGYLQIIKGSSNVLLQLISDILDLSKIEAGEVALNLQSFSPLELAEEAIRSYSATAEGKGLLLYSCVDTDLPGKVLGDGMRVRQIVNNLLSNAIKFTSTGKIVLHLRVLGREDGRVRLQWEVVDTGVGISKEHQINLFEPFFQADNQQSGTNGAGLGLTICWQLSQLMGGELKVSSVPLLGSNFSFEVQLLELESSVLLPRAIPVGTVKVHVRSPEADLTGEICHWLEMSMGGVIEWSEQASVTSSDKDLLLELYGDSIPPIEWSGPRVLAAAHASIHPLRDVHGWHVNIHSRLEITRAVMLSMGWLVESAVLQDDKLAEVPLGLRVLLAEDHPVNQALLSEQLERLGCSVITVSNGESAFHMLEVGEFDVLLTDVNMPVMDGYELTKLVRSSDSSIPIVAVTANVLQGEGDRCISAGMNAWLTKPVSLAALRSCLKAVTEGKVVRLGEATSRSGIPLAEDDASGLPMQMRKLFVDSMKKDLDAVYAAKASDDVSELIFLLHRIRGALAVVKIPYLIKASLEIELILKKGKSLPLMSNKLERFLEMVNTVVERIESESKK